MGLQTKESISLEDNSIKFQRIKIVAKLTILLGGEVGKKNIKRV
jgi:hypothetical protein